MPLDPKQQPPYYTIGTMPTPGGMGAYSRLHYEIDTIVTTGTTETDLFTYDLPANTLTTDGDTLIIEFMGVNTVPAENHITRLYWNAIGEGAYTETVIGDFKWLVKIIRMTSSAITLTTQMWQEGGTQVGKPDVTIDGGPYDFTTIIPILFTGQCTGLATIQTHNITIDKIKQP